MMLAFGGLLVGFLCRLMLMTLAFGGLLSQLMRLLVPAHAHDAGLWVASCPSHARAWAADAHDARLWLASCPSLCS